jgi:hypothetical protein
MDFSASSSRLTKELLANLDHLHAHGPSPDSVSCTKKKLKKIIRDWLVSSLMFRP